MTTFDRHIIAPFKIYVIINGMSFVVMHPKSFSPICKKNDFWLVHSESPAKTPDAFVSFRSKCRP